MKILKADYVLTCNSCFETIENGAVCFDEKILKVGKAKDIEGSYQDAEIIYLGKNSVLMPGLINPHVHLEFSANRTSLKYGDFILWLNSVIKNREDILQKGGSETINNALEEMLHSGTTTLGEISSFGDDFESCLKTPQKVVYFIEILGSRPDSVDILFENFRSRLHISEDNRNGTFIPAISVHSPYSTHPILTKNVLDIARKEGHLVSTHFMESQAERDWLDRGDGDFIKFFNSFAPNSRPLSGAKEYLNLFYDTSALFTHCTKATQEEIKMIEDMGGFITHCPVSNRLLNSGKLSIDKIDKNILTLGTDGLSSNISLNLWDEMRSALMLHSSNNLHDISKQLLQMCTLNGAKALNLNSGVLEADRDTDMIVIKLPEKLQSTEQLPIELILQTKKADKVFIDGKEI